MGEPAKRYQRDAGSNQSDYLRVIMAKAILSHRRLLDLLHYDPETGIFTRLVCTSSQHRVGEAVGRSHGNGYLKTPVDGAVFKMHRLAWFYMTGAWPKDKVDHINGERADNRWSNLREVSGAENAHNQRRPHRSGSTGFLGVRAFRHHMPGPKRYTAVIALDGKRRHLGVFYTPEEAHVAYVSAKRKLHSTCTI